MEATEMSINGSMDKQNMTRTYNGILFSLKKGILTRAATGMNLENFMLSERCYKKDKYHIIPLI